MTERTYTECIHCGKLYWARVEDSEPYLCVVCFEGIAGLPSVDDGEDAREVAAV